jgi:hypothetical protein
LQRRSQQSKKAAVVPYCALLRGWVGATCHVPLVWGGGWGPGLSLSARCRRYSILRTALQTAAAAPCTALIRDQEMQATTHRPSPVSCARDQVVIARPPVLTPPWRYRRSLVSKRRFAVFTTSINAICVGAGVAPPPEPTTTPTSQRLTPPSIHTGSGW